MAAILLFVASCPAHAEDAAQGEAQASDGAKRSALEARPPGGDPAGSQPTSEILPPEPKLSSADPKLVSADAEGERALAAANRHIRLGESADDDALRRREYETALEHAARAITLLPASADARFAHFAAAGRIAQMDGLARSALKLYSLNAELDEVLRLNPNHANALAARGGMLVKLPRLLGGDTKKGISLLERAVALDDESVGKRLELAEAYHIVGDDPRATSVANQALAKAEYRQDSEKVKLCQKFITELAGSCRGCSLAAAGR
jgi:tetratricopeptide (TPR) repeat protein